MQEEARVSTLAVQLQPVPTEKILPLRRAVLCALIPRVDPNFEGDDEPHTTHIAAITEDGEVVGGRAADDGGEGDAVPFG